VAHRSLHRHVSPCYQSLFPSIPRKVGLQQTDRNNQMSITLCISTDQEWLSSDRGLIFWQALRLQKIDKFVKFGQIAEMSGSESEGDRTS